jgi:hypothetical protein
MDILEKYDLEFSAMGFCEMDFGVKSRYYFLA